MTTKHAIWQRESLQRHVVRSQADGSQEVMLVIDGLRCGGCVISLERALTAVHGVKRVRINAASQRASILWEAEKCNLSQLLDSIVNAGFQARPLDARALDDRRREESRDALKRLLVAGFGAMQAMMFATVLYLDAINPVNESTRELFRWLGFLIATPVVFYSARPFFSGALRALRARQLGMDVPVALAVAMVYGASLVSALHGSGEVYFDSVSMFVFFLLTGRYLEMRGRHRALDLTDALSRLLPDVAQRRTVDGQLEAVPIVELSPGDIVAVDSAGIVPGDGELLSEHCRVDESFLTGESLACLRQRGQGIRAGSLVLEGPVELKLTRVGSDTSMAKVANLVEKAQAERPRLARAGESIVTGFVFLVLSLAAVTGLAWSMIAPEHAFHAVVAVLVVSCPCAFALAVPVAFTRALSVLAKNGVLVGKPDALEMLAKSSHVVIDKTGTLTHGLQLESIQCLLETAVGAPQNIADLDERHLKLRNLAIALAKESSHPVSRAVAVTATAADNIPEASQVKTKAGLGVEAWVGNRRLRFGRARFAYPEWRRDELDSEDLILADENSPLARFKLSEALRPSALEGIELLRQQGLKIGLASGDQFDKVRNIAARLGLGAWHAQLLPQDKLAHLQKLKQQGACVVAVGDGINDAPILAGADVSIGMGSGTDLARASSDIVLAGEDLRQIAATRRVAQQTLQVIQQNQRWALAYNLCAIPLAALGFIPPWLAALGMSASSLGVVINALRIGRNISPRPAAAESTEFVTAV